MFNGQHWRRPYSRLSPRNACRSWVKSSPADSSRRWRVCAVNLIEGAALGLEPECPEPDHAEDIPRSKVGQRRAEHDEIRRGGLDQIARAHDQRQPERADELPAIADAIAEAHTAGTQPGWPDLRHVRPDNGVDGAAEKALRHDQDVEQGSAADIDIVHVAGENHQNGCQHAIEGT